MPNSHSAVVRRPSARRRNAESGLPTRLVSVGARHRQREGAIARVRSALFDALEPRTLLSVSSNNGFTTITPEAGSKVIYVSTRGSDGNSGLSPSAPIYSLSKGISMLSGGSGDQLLLERGDTFYGTLGYWTKSGRSASQPLVVGTYGSGSRPVVNTGSTYALSSGVAGGISHIAIEGISFVSNGSAIADGISLSGKASDVLIEDCEITRYVNNIVLQKFFGPITDVTLRRDIVTDSFSRGGRNSEGLYAEGVNGIDLEGNVFDHNGWGNGRSATVFNHDAYIRSTCTGFVARSNIFSNASSHGLQARAGGIIENNLFINDATGLSFGLVNGSPVTPGGVSGHVTNNVFMGTHNIGSQLRGVAIEVGNIRGGGTTISGNIIANGSPGTDLPGISLAVGSNNDNYDEAVGINDLTVSGNVIYNWSVGIWVVGGQAPGSGPTALNDLAVHDNDLQHIATATAIIRGSLAGSFWNNRYTTQIYNKAYSNGGGTNASVSYPDPGRTPGSLAGGSNQGFVDLARGQSESNWNYDYTADAAIAYVKAGFGDGSFRGSPPPPPPTSAKKLTGTVIGTTGSWSNLGNTRDKAFDGNFGTFFDAPVSTVNTTTWTGLDLKSAHVITLIKFASRSGYESRMVGGKFQASNSATFASGVVTLYTVARAPSSTAWTNAAISSPTGYRFVRYLSPAGDWGNVSEIEFDGK